MTSLNNHLSTGAFGETLAADFIQKKGFKVLERNYRYKRAEIDIIAVREKLLVFVEVKTRRTNNFGLPEDSVTLKKSKNLFLAADNYIYESGWEYEIRFDVISVLIRDEVEIEHLEDVF